MTQTYTERKIQELKDCGQFILDHAEDIITTNKAAVDMSILIRVHPGRARVILTSECLPRHPSEK